jgi:uncharacterized protein with von Willebrand factor type A (vWA) domain
VTEGAPFVSVLVAFADQLRDAGLTVGSGDVLTYSAALARLDPTDLLDLYWAGRTTIVTRREDIPVYDRVFRRFFLDDGEALPEPLRLSVHSAAEISSTLVVPATEPSPESPQEHAARLGLIGSGAEVLRNKAFSACTAEELAALRRITARMRLNPPRRRTRRTAVAKRGRIPDPRRMVRETMRTHGEPSKLFWRSRRRRVRPLILIVDISGSMADYSRGLLQFAHSAKRADTRVETFCFGTRLTRITKVSYRCAGHSAVRPGD